MHRSIIPTWYTIFYINYIELSSSTYFERHPLIFRRSMMLIVHVCRMYTEWEYQRLHTCTINIIDLLKMSGWRSKYVEELTLCNLCKKLCIKLVSIKESCIYLVNLLECKSASSWTKYNKNLPLLFSPSPLKSCYQLRFAAAFFPRTTLYIRFLD